MGEKIPFGNQKVKPHDLSTIQECIKIVLLGASDSGKTTLFSLLNLMFDQNFYDYILEAIDRM